MDYASLGLAAALTTLLSWTLGTFAFAEAAKRIPAHTTNQIRLLFAWLMLTVMACVVYSKGPAVLFTLPEARQWIWLGASGIVGLTIGDFFLFSAFQLMGPRYASLFSALAPAAALITGIFLLDEGISWMGIIGIFITLSGIMWTILLRKEVGNFHFEQHRTKAIIFGVMASVCQGIGLVMAKKGLVDSSFHPIHATWIRMMFAVGTIYVLEMAKGNFKLIIAPVIQYRHSMKYVLAGTLFGPVIGVSLSLYAATHIEAYLAQTIFSMLPIMVLPFAYIFYREKAPSSAWIAAIIAVCGVLVLTYQYQIAAYLSF